MRKTLADKYRELQDQVDTVHRLLDEAGIPSADDLVERVRVLIGMLPGNDLDDVLAKLRAMMDELE